MKTKMFLKLSLLYCLLLSADLYAQNREIKTHRISERVLIVTLCDQVPFMGYINSIVLSTDKGIVVVDTWPLPSQTEHLKRIIRSAFGNNKFAYVLNMNTSIDHLGGNSVFPEAMLITHQNYVKGVKDGIQQAEEYFDTMIPMFQKQLASLDENSAGANSARQQIQLMQENREKLKTEFRYVPPTMTFSDRMTLHCGDITLQIIYYGSAFTDSDIVIYIPEEKLLLNGNAFTLLIPPETFPNPNSNYDRWISILTEFLDPEKSIETIVPSNLIYDYMKKEDLRFIRDYYRELWQSINTAQSEGRTIEEIKKELSLDRRFADCSYFKDVLTTSRFQEWRDYFKWLKAQKFNPSDDIGDLIRILHTRNITTMWKHAEKYKVPLPDE